MMEVSQRSKVQKTHNAGLVVTILLEVLALVLLCTIECFIRQVYRSFAFYCPPCMVSNNLPSALRDNSVSPNNFKRKLDTSNRASDG